MENECNEIDFNFQHKLKRVCYECLCEKWANFDEFTASKIECGVANRIYKCSLKRGNECKSVVIRLYGSDLVDKVMSGNDDKSNKPLLFEEAVISVLSDNLSKAGLSPKVIGVFSGGRIEEYVQGRNLVIEDFNDKSLYLEIARKLAKFHLTTIAVRQRPMLFETVMDFMNITLEPDYSLIDVQHHDVVKQLFDFPLIAEFKWAFEMAPKLNSRIVLAHNDISLNNIILRTNPASETDRIVFVDFDLSGYHYRGYDFSFFFHTNEFQVTPNKDNVVIEYKGGKFDSNMKRMFINEYLKQLRALDSNFSDEIDNYEQIVKEINFFDLQHYLILLSFTKVLFADKNKKMSYGHISPLLRRYEEQKQYFIQNYSEHIQQLIQ